MKEYSRLHVYHVYRDAHSHAHMFLMASEWKIAIRLNDISILCQLIPVHATPWTFKKWRTDVCEGTCQTESGLSISIIESELVCNYRFLLLTDSAQLTAAALTKTFPIAQEIHEKVFFVLDTLDLKAVSSVDTNIINSVWHFTVDLDRSISQHSVKMVLSRANQRRSKLGPVCLSYFQVSSFK